MMEYKRLTISSKNIVQQFENIKPENRNEFCLKCFDRLAELEDKIENGTLIEQKTCENISEMHPVDGFTCSECGISLEDYCEKEVDEENGDITYRKYVLRYCPNCGAKVQY